MLPRESISSLAKKGTMESGLQRMLMDQLSNRCLLFHLSAARQVKRLKTVVIEWQLLADMSPRGLARWLPMQLDYAS
jgi:hypothetical protein